MGPPGGPESGPPGGPESGPRFRSDFTRNCDPCRKKRRPRFAIRRLKPCPAFPPKSNFLDADLAMPALWCGTARFTHLLDRLHVRKPTHWATCATHLCIDSLKMRTTLLTLRVTSSSAHSASAHSRMLESTYSKTASPSPSKLSDSAAASRLRNTSDSILALR